MTLCIKEELSYHFSKGYEGDLIMKSAEEITVVNVFNPVYLRNLSLITDK